MSDGLQEVLEKLLSKDISAPARGTFSAIAIPKFPKHYFGITDDSSPCLLLYAKPIGDILVRALRLRGIEIQYNMPCRVAILGGHIRDETLTIISCVTKETVEREYFVHASEIVLKIVGAEPNLSTVVSATEHLANIFQRLDRPPRKSLTGLLGELMLIREASSPCSAVMAWRNADDDKYDFATEEFRVEVKAAKSRTRVHYITYDQCHPPRGTIGLLASIIIESSGGGTSLGELIREIEHSLGTNTTAILRLHEIVADTLGHSLLNSLTERFDKPLARESIQFYDLRMVPAIRGKLPPGVMNVRFQSDLGRTPTADVQSLVAQAPVLRDLLPDIS